MPQRPKPGYGTTITTGECAVAAVAEMVMAGFAHRSVRLTSVNVGGSFKLENATSTSGTMYEGFSATAGRRLHAEVRGGGHSQ